MLQAKRIALGRKTDDHEEQTQSGSTFITGELRINKQVYQVGGELVVSEPKAKAAIRTIILLPPVVNVLNKYKSTAVSWWLFPSPKKEDIPMSPQIVRQRLQRLLDHADYKRVRFHDLRHTFTANALEHGMDVKTLPTIIAHVSNAITPNVYAHVTDDMKSRLPLRLTGASPKWNRSLT